MEVVLNVEFEDTWLLLTWFDSLIWWVFLSQVRRLDQPKCIDYVQMLALTFMDVVHSTSLPIPISPTVQYRLEQVNTGVVISIFQGHFVIQMLLITFYPCLCIYRFICMWLGRRREVLSKSNYFVMADWCSNRVYVRKQLNLKL